MELKLGADLNEIGFSVTGNWAVWIWILGPSPWTPGQGSYLDLFSSLKPPASFSDLGNFHPWSYNLKGKEEIVLKSTILIYKCTKKDTTLILYICLENSQAKAEPCWKIVKQRLNHVGK